MFDLDILANVLPLEIVAVANITLCFAKSSLGHAIITYTTPEAVLRAAQSSRVSVSLD